jgi:hypothetical protein
MFRFSHLSHANQGFNGISNGLNKWWPECIIQLLKKCQGRGQVLYNVSDTNFREGGLTGHLEMGIKNGACMLYVSPHGSVPAWEIDCPSNSTTRSLCSSASSSRFRLLPFDSCGKHRHCQHPVTCINISVNISPPSNSILDAAG